jgi:hypothetical protein
MSLQNARMPLSWATIVPSTQIWQVKLGMVVTETWEVATETDSATYAPDRTTIGMVVSHGSAVGGAVTVVSFGGSA